MKKKQHSHNFVEDYKGMGAFGFDRKSDEETLIYTLQKFSDDKCLSTLIPRLSDEELERLHNSVYAFLQKYFSEEEYHSIFLKDDHKH